MGGAGYIFTGEHDAAVMHNSATINLNVLEAGTQAGVRRFFYSSSACIYPERNQMDPDNPNCAEASAYPAAPDSEYGWEKLFSERLYLAYMRNYGIQVRIARFHNIFGPEGTWTGGKEKAPAAICRKVAEADDRRRDRDLGRRPADAVVSLHRRVPRGRPPADGLGLHRPGQHRLRGDDQRSSGLALMMMDIAAKPLRIRQHPRTRPACAAAVPTTDLIRAQLGWAPNEPLRGGMARTFDWISNQVAPRSAPVAAGGRV